MRRIKAIVYGAGVIGRLATKYMVEKGIDIVGAIDVNPAVVGKDLGEVAGLGRPLNVKINDDADAVLSEQEADIAIVSIFSQMDRMYPFFEKCIKNGLNVITPSEEALYPWETAPELAAKVDKLAKKHGARVMVDDAHALGVLGEGGRGTPSHFGLEADVDLQIGTFSKSLASIGGWVTGPAEVLDWVRHFGRSMLFSASLPPTNLAAAHTALRILKEEPERVDKLRSNASYMRKELQAMGYDTMDSTTPVIPLLIGDDYKTIQYWRALLDAGVYVNPVMYPAVEEGHALVRTSYMATHERSHLDHALEVLRSVGRQFEILQ